MINDLAAIVGIDAQGRKWHHRRDLIERGQRPFYGPALSLPVVDDDRAPTSRPAMCDGLPYCSTACIAVKRQNLVKWPPRRDGRYLTKDRGFPDANQNLGHSCPSGQGAHEVAAGP